MADREKNKTNLTSAEVKELSGEYANMDNALPAEFSEELSDAGDRNAGAEMQAKRT
ncbi:hypothetical protein [Pseudalkalibacillus caeni]|uniref:hypothetical protein n=1 Tax=Exobacillus caeni TaxID=2574798 RepID=UPI001484E917|nr:hypothetical protein [Pseudalkalibacillus caeni]